MRHLLAAWRRVTANGKSGSMYHGTPFEFKPGDVLEGGKGEAQWDYGDVGMNVVWMHDNPEAAKLYGENVYEVEALDWLENYSMEAGHDDLTSDRQEWISPKVRVVRKVTASSPSDDPERWRQRQEVWDRGGTLWEEGPIEQTRDIGNFIMYATAPSFYDGSWDRTIKVTTRDGIYVADMFFGPERGGIEGVPEVHPDYRRQGIGTAMYSWAEELSGLTIMPATQHSELAEEFWNQPDRPFGASRRASLVTRPGVFWRAHPVGRPFEVGGGSSQIIFTEKELETHNFPEPLTRVSEGYSSFADPGHLWQYAVEMGWADDGGDWLTDPVDIIAFEGKIVGSGWDGEPTVRPTSQPFERMSWEDFDLKVSGQIWDEGEWYNGINMPVEGKLAYVLPRPAKGGTVMEVPLSEVLGYEMGDGNWSEIREMKLEQAKGGSAQFSGWGLDPGEPSLYESIRDEGLWEAIQVLEDGDGVRWVWNGHTRLAVVEDLGWSMVPIEISE